MVASGQGYHALPICGPIPRQRRKRRGGFCALRQQCAKEQPPQCAPPRPSAGTRVPHRRPKGNATLTLTRVRETLQTAYEDGGDEREPARDKPAHSPGNVPPQREPKPRHSGRLPEATARTTCATRPARQQSTNRRHAGADGRSTTSRTAPQGQSQ